MKILLKKITEYVFRSWDDVDHIHPRVKILPPFLFDVLKFLIYILIITAVFSYLFKY